MGKRAQKNKFWEKLFPLVRGNNYRVGGKVRQLLKLENISDEKFIKKLKNAPEVAL